MKDKKPFFKIGDKLTFKSSRNCISRGGVAGSYYYGGKDKVTKNCTVISVIEYINKADCYSVAVKYKGSIHFRMLESEFIEWDIKQEIERDIASGLSIGDISLNRPSSHFWILNRIQERDEELQGYVEDERVEYVKCVKVNNKISNKAFTKGKIYKGWPNLIGDNGYQFKKLPYDGGVWDFEPSTKEEYERQEQKTLNRMLCDEVKTPTFADAWRGKVSKNTEIMSYGIDRASGGLGGLHNGQVFNLAPIQSIGRSTYRHSVITSEAYDELCRALNAGKTSLEKATTREDVKRFADTIGYGTTIINRCTLRDWIKKDTEEVKINIERVDKPNINFNN